MKSGPTSPNAQYSRAPTECMHRFSAYPESMHLCTYMPIRYGSAKFMCAFTCTFVRVYVQV